MTAHLLLVTLGPVQDFIAQARRTRDLWYGSHMLSELGRAAARALVGGDAQLISGAGKKRPRTCSLPGSASARRKAAPEHSQQTSGRGAFRD